MLQPFLTLSLVLCSPLPLVKELRSLSPNRLTLKAFYLNLLLLKLILQQASSIKFKFYAIRPRRLLFMTTRAPYRYKLTRNQYMLQRYYYVFKLTLLKYKTTNLNQVLTFQAQVRKWSQRLDIAHTTLTSTQVTSQFTHSFTENG